MKKFVKVLGIGLLTLCFCMTLCACDLFDKLPGGGGQTPGGSENIQDDFIGIYECRIDGDVLTAEFKADGNCILTEKYGKSAYDGTYEKNGDKFTATFYDGVYTQTMDGDILSDGRIYFNDLTFVKRTQQGNAPSGDDYKKEISGTYYGTAHARKYSYELKKDGTFECYEYDELEAASEYAVDGNNVTFTVGDSVKPAVLQNGILLFDSDTVLVKHSEAYANDKSLGLYEGYDKETHKDVYFEFCEDGVCVMEERSRQNYSPVVPQIGTYSVKSSGINITINGSSYTGMLTGEYMTLSGIKFVHWEGVCGVYEFGDTYRKEVLSYNIYPLGGLRVGFKARRSDISDNLIESVEGSCLWDGEKECITVTVDGDNMYVTVENNVLVMLDNSLAPFVKRGNGLGLRCAIDAWTHYSGYCYENGSQWSTHCFVLLQNGVSVCAIQGGPRQEQDAKVQACAVSDCVINGTELTFDILNWDKSRERITCTLADNKITINNWLDGEDFILELTK